MSTQPTRVTKTIGFIGNCSVDDRASNSGVPQATFDALQQRCEKVVELGPFPTGEPSLPLQAFRKVYRIVTRRNYYWLYARPRAVRWAREITRSLESKPCDILFAPMPHMLVLALRTSHPLAIYTDATLGATIRMGGYPTQHMPSWQVSQALRLERACFQRASVIITMSQWAADSVIADYGIAKTKVFVVPPGANWLATETPRREEALRRPPETPFNLLVVGRGWKRKGVDVAIEVIHELSDMNIDARLTVIGARPPRGVRFDEQDLDLLPALDKNVPADSERLANSFTTADVLLFPSRADTFGIVCGEASAFGLPTIARNVGGIGEAVKDQSNGILLPRSATPLDFARAIAGLVQNPERYTALSRSSRDRFESELNWPNWGDRVAELLASIQPQELTVRD